MLCSGNRLLALRAYSVAAEALDTVGMFGRSLTAALLTATLFLGGGEARQLAARGSPRPQRTLHGHGSEPLDTSNYRFLTNKTKRMLNSSTI